MTSADDAPLGRRRTLRRDGVALLLVLAAAALSPWLPLGRIEGAWLGVARADDPGHADLRVLRERLGGGDSIALVLQGEPPATEHAAAALVKEISTWKDVGSVVGPRPGFAPPGIVSDDRRAAAIYVETLPESAGAATFALVSRLRALEVPDGVQVAVAGSVVEEILLGEVVEKDRRVIVPLVFLALVLLGWWMLGSIAGAAALAVSLLLSLVLTMGAYGVLFGPLTTLTTSLVAIVLGITAANLTHVAIAFHGYRRRMPPAEAAAAAAHHGHRGCLLATFTTAVGFLSTMTMRIPEFTRLGVGGAIGCVVAYLVTMGFLPALLARMWVLPWRRRPVGAPLTAIAVRDVRKRGWIGPAFLVAILVLAFGTVWLRPGTRLLSELPDRSQAREVTRVLDEKLGGASHLYVLWTAPLGWRNEEGLARLAKADRLIEERIPNVRAAVGPGTVVERLRATPLGSKGSVALLALAESGALGRLPRWVDAEGTVARIAVRFPAMVTGELVASAERLEEALRPLARAGERVVATGSILLIARSAEEVVGGGASSFLVSMLVVSLIAAVALRSWRAMPVLWVPNLLPLLGVLGLLGWTDTPVSFSSAVVGSIVLGMTSDDTLHFLVRGERERLAPARLVALLGPAFIGTTSVLVAGAAVMSLGEAKPVALFSRLLALGVGLALVCDLFLTPRLYGLLRGGRRRGGRRP